ncbi:MAG: response regulator transcription factor [Anaerolineae bacterium]|nr:response regulator transcription factor [Anaerolineae bacterium]
MNRKILVADDEQHLLNTVRAYLENAGFQVTTVKNGRDALFAARHEQPDLVLLDVMMPEMDGWQVARLLRKESDVPILFLTARIDETDQITGLEIGADEYVTKPFSPRVLVAKVRAILRRAYGDLSSEPITWRVGGLELNTATYTVTKDGRRIDVTPSEFDLLKVLIGRPGRVFTRMELLDQTQGEAYAAYERTIDVHIKNLRAKIEDDPRNPQYIETVYGVGYRMRADE